MVDIVCGVLKLTIGFLAGKIREEVIARLQDGDVTDEECHQLIVRELDDIKSKLDGLARKDLLSSLCFLQEGVDVLYQSLLPLKASVKIAELTEQDAVTETSDPSINQAIALLDAITSVDIHSNRRFKSAIESFKLARQKATEAFCNKALLAEDRIQASQVRILARILEKMEDPEASVSNCLVYLKQLHEVGAIQETFSVQVDGGMKSLFNQKKRLANAASVHILNQVLFEFTKKFTNMRLAIYDWPEIQVTKGFYNPIFGEYNLIEKLEMFGVKVMSPYPNYTFEDKISPGLSAVNSNTEIVAKMFANNTIKVFKSSGESRTLCKVSRDKHASEKRIVAIDVDAEDNLYLIAAFQGWSDQSHSFTMFIFDQNGEKKVESLLPFLPNTSWQKVRMAVKNDGQIAILNYDEKTLYVGNISTQFNSFKIDNELSRESLGNIRFSDFIGANRIISADKTAAYMYTENGVLLRKIVVPEGHGFIASVAINHKKKSVMILTSRVADRYNLFSYSETGELMNSLCFGHSEWIGYAQLVSHRNGAVALVCKKGAALLQLK